MALQGCCSTEPVRDAQAFARLMGFKIEDDLNTEKSRKAWLEWKRRTDPEHYLDPIKRERAGLLATLESDNPVLASVDTANWAEERGYQAQAGPEAWAAFVQARRDAYSFLGCLPESAWHRSARHPRLGNITLAQQVGRIVDHDRSHLAQVRVTRQKAVQ